MSVIYDLLTVLQRNDYVYNSGLYGETTSRIMLCMGIGDVKLWHAGKCQSRS